MITLRPMKNRDMARLAKYQLPKFFGVVFVEDGKDIGSGAVVFDQGRALLSLEITDELRQKPLQIIKVGKKLIEGATQNGGELFAVQQDDEPTAGRLLGFLGFKPTNEMKNGGRIYQWQR